MARRIELGDITVDVTLKRIKNIHLSVHPPTGQVRISAPLHVDMETLRVFVASKLGWIKKQQQRLQGQERETRREYIDRESHYAWGRRYLLQVHENDGAPGVELKHSQMILHVRPGADRVRKQAVLDAWYHQQIRQAAPALIAKWEAALGVKAKRLYVRRMKTKWGSCNPRAGSVRLNSELAKKPPECLEYVVVHELAHLIEPTHNARFAAVMDKHLPNWKLLRSELNRAPLGDVE